MKALLRTLRSLLWATTLASVALLSAPSAQQETPRATRLTWTDVAPLRARLGSDGQSAEAFTAYVDRLRAESARRVREGDLDHLVFYLLQSTHVSRLPPIEPALSAKALVEGLDPREREIFLRTGEVPLARVDAAVRARVTAVLRALESPGRDARLIYFRELVTTTVPQPGRRAPWLQHEYLRAMRFLYQKEFVAQRAPDAATAVADLYRRRGLSTDTAVEAGYVVYLGLGVVKALESERRIRRVLIIGPGLDLAPRTAFQEVGPPESYQPWSVIDALLGLGLAQASDLEVVAADINPRVVSHLRRARAQPPRLELVSEIRESPTITFSSDYRDYFTQLGRAIADGPTGATAGRVVDGHLRKTVAVGPVAARALEATPLDIVTERLDGPAFDLVIATNILPYFDDEALTLALSNVAAMLAPGGVFLHNEARPAMGALAAAVGLRAEQSRRAVIATVRGAPAPLFDSVWLHRHAKP